MPTAWRIVKPRHAAAPFDGEGARIAGGRWNTPGTRMIYTSSSAALAVLEMLVHLQATEILRSYVLFSCTFDEALIQKVDAATLPRNWRSYPAPPQLQMIGDDWVRSADSAVLEVPSAIVPMEPNFLINPEHRDFRRIKTSDRIRLDLDTRLKR